MIQVQTWLKTRDNSGARSVECIQTLGGFHRSFSYPGDTILVSIKRLRLLRKVKVGQIHLALITRTRKDTMYKDGTSSRCENNVVLLMNRKKRVLGTRFFGWVSRRLRRKKFLRILLLCGRHVILKYIKILLIKLMNTKLIEQIKPNFSNPTDFSVSIYNEHKQYNLKLHQVSIFPYANINTLTAFSKAVLSFRFRSIEFSKKRALPFFLAMELLTHRKCVASLSQRNIQAWKIRKGRLVGCKVTLRRQGLDDFIDMLTLTFPRREKFQPTRNFLSKAAKKVYSFSRKYVPAYSLSLGELVLFYPIELGLGLHPDVQRLELKFAFKSLSIEEHYFTLRYFKIPVL